MIVLYDSECNFCNHSVQFIIKRDPKMHFHFAHLSSDVGQQFIHDLNIPSDIDSLILIKDNQYFTESTAALHISKHLNNAWPLFYTFIFIPKFLRDFVYQLIANNRYALFGKAKSCKILSPKDRNRFL